MRNKINLSEPTQKVWISSMMFFTAILFVVSFSALMCGQYEITSKQVISALWPNLNTNVELNDTIIRVVKNIRLPRVLLAIISGAGLGIAGASFQGLFSNPLATADTLGVSAGASFGAALGILLGGSGFQIQIYALAGGIIAVTVVYLIGNSKENQNLIMIVLAGIVVSALFQALVGIIKYVADPQDQLPSITFWLMGSLSSASFKELRIGAPLIILGIIVLYLLKWKINALTLQEDEAKALGIPVAKLRIIIIFASTLVTASIISMCGQISWIALLVPHIARMLYGNNHRFVLPASLVFGGISMVIIDTVARTLTTAEIPISILTAIIGAPVFVVLLRKTGGIKG